jgi:hypothetical protein
MIYTVYKTINKINNKEYVGFHKVNDVDDIVCVESKDGSIYRDGYMGSGKNMRAALEKYGPMNMKQELLFSSRDKKEAEDIEASIVTREWVDSNDTYNLTAGGNVTILFGEANGFYGKTHSEETIRKIQENRYAAWKKSPWSFGEILHVESGTVLYTHREVYAFYEKKMPTRNRSFLYSLVANGELQYKSSFLHDIALRKHQEYLNKPSQQEIRKMRSDGAKARFTNVPKTPESNEKRGASISKWISENPEAHAERMNKINKNPQKIAKMVEKQLGSKWYFDPATMTRVRCKLGDAPPLGYVLGVPKK